jgi:hypothetical protein
VTGDGLRAQVADVDGSPNTDRKYPPASRSVLRSRRRSTSSSAMIPLALTKPWRLRAVARKPYASARCASSSSRSEMPSRDFGT